MKKFLIGLIVVIIITLVSMVSIGINNGFFVGLNHMWVSDLTDYMKENPDNIYIDLRNPEQYEQGHVMGFSNIQSDEILNDEITIANQKTVVLIDQTGEESKEVGKHLSKKGYDVIAVSGGMQDYDGVLG